LGLRLQVNIFPECPDAVKKKVNEKRVSALNGAWEADKLKYLEFETMQLPVLGLCFSWDENEWQIVRFETFVIITCSCASV
jgi:hypothetical protein